MNFDAHTWTVIAAYTYAAFLGASLGSFYFALATRVSYYFYSPQRKRILGRLNRFRAILFQPSFCMSCGAPIRRWHLIPVAGYFLARGRCASCKEAISATHLLAEFYCMLLLPVLLFMGASWPLAITSTLFAGHLMVSMVTDARHFLLDHENTFVLIALASLKVFLDDEPALGHALTGAGVLLFFGAAYLLYRRLGRAGLGAGDILYSAAVGSMTGFPECLPVFGAAGLVAALYSWIQSRGSAPAPFGACLGAAALAWLLLRPLLAPLISAG